MPPLTGPGGALPLLPPPLSAPDEHKNISNKVRFGPKSIKQNEIIRLIIISAFVTTYFHNILSNHFLAVWRIEIVPMATHESRFKLRPSQPVSVHFMKKGARI